MKTRQEIEHEIIKKASQDDDFLKELKESPKETLSQFLPQDMDIPEGVTINVVQETPTSLTIVLPPKAKSELSEDELDAVSGGYLSGGSPDTQKSQGCDPFPFYDI